MHTVLLFLFPAVVDMVLGSFFFVASVRVAESGAPAVAVTTVSTIWGLSYMISAFLVGQKVSVTNCRAMQIGGCLGLASCSLMLLVASSTTFLYVIMVFLGISVALFFPPYMVFMKSAEGERSSGCLAASTALYTMAWSLGLAAGPFLAGMIWNVWGWRWVAGLDAGLALATAVGLAVFFAWQDYRKDIRSSLPPEPIPCQPQESRTPFPDFAWLARLCSGVAMLAVAMVRGVFPATAHALGVPKHNQGIALALICLGQAAVSLILTQSTPVWFYRVGPVLTYGLAGVTGIALFGTAGSISQFYIGAALLGIYGGAAYIYMVFHALVHPVRAGRNAGLNEAVIGLTGIVGPAVAGMLADRISHSAPYYVAVIVVICTLVVQAVVHFQARVRVGCSTL